MTPIIGVLSDKYEFKKFGRRKFWYCIGVVIVSLSFALIF